MKNPEVENMRMKVIRRMLMMFVLGVFVVLTALHRVDVLRVDPKGIFGTILLVAALSAVVFLTLDRTSYLPFLGECVFPTSLLVPQTPKDATFMVNVKVKSGATHVVYWAAESGVGLVPDPFDAYGNFSNAGVVRASASGDAVLPVRCPSRYQIPGGRTLPRHVHYRALFKSGIAGPVHTTQVTCL
jgi:hypothetical protein